MHSFTRASIIDEIVYLTSIYAAKTLHSNDVDEAINLTFIISMLCEPVFLRLAEHFFRS
jgi:hypothetical protein